MRQDETTKLLPVWYDISHGAFQFNTILSSTINGYIYMRVYDSNTVFDDQRINNKKVQFVLRAFG